MRVVTFNVNGIRAAQRRGFESWLVERDPDVVALQEVRCRPEQLPSGVFGSHHLTYEPGQLAGRNGVAVLTRTRPDAVRTWDGEVLMRAAGEEHTHTEPAPPGTMARGLSPFASEGRYVEVDIGGTGDSPPLTVASLYLPKGGLPAHMQKPGGREAPEPGVELGRDRELSREGGELSRGRSVTDRLRDVLGRDRELEGTGDVGGDGGSGKPSIRDRLKQVLQTPGKALEQEDGHEQERGPKRGKVQELRRDRDLDLDDGHEL